MVAAEEHVEALCAEARFKEQIMDMKNKRMAVLNARDLEHHRDMEDLHKILADKEKEIETLRKQLDEATNSQPQPPGGLAPTIANGNGLFLAMTCQPAVPVYENRYADEAPVLALRLGRPPRRCFVPNCPNEARAGNPLCHSCGDSVHKGTRDSQLGKRPRVDSSPYDSVRDE